jgi:hypothetical protein
MRFTDDPKIQKTIAKFVAGIDKLINQLAREMIREARKLRKGTKPVPVPKRGPGRPRKA